MRTQWVIRMMPGVIAIPFFLSGVEASHQTHDHSHEPGAPTPSVGSVNFREVIPEFCAIPTIASIQSGPWSDPATWSLGRIPGSNDAVEVAAGTEIAYDRVSDDALDCVKVDAGGHLAFKPDVNTRLKVGTLVVFGHLDIGTEAKPVDADVKAELIIADHPLDTMVDPNQFGTALLVQDEGKLTIHGALKAPGFVRLAQEPTKGATTLFTAEPVASWKPGDRIALPDTRQLTLAERNTYVPQIEEFTIGAVTGGNQIALVGSVQFDHTGARNGNGVLEFLPHAANLTRNVVIRSEHPTGTRGHVLAMDQADVDIRYAEFDDLGRTKAEECLDSTIFDAMGNVLYIGSNQIGRYAVHFHHLRGPALTPANGYQVTLIGNAINGSPKWGVTIHDTHFGLIQGNVVYGAVGTGIMLEAGNEFEDIVERNFVLNSQGSGEGIESRVNEKDFGHEGAGIWSRGPLSTIRDNVVSSVRLSGFAFYLGKLGTVNVPRFKGADTVDPMQTRPVRTGSVPLQHFTGNESYGAIKNGFEFWFFGGTVPSRVEEFVAWHTHAFGVKPFYSPRIDVNGVVVRGNPALLADPKESSIGIRFNQGPYLQEITVNGVNVQGMRIGLNMPARIGTIRGSYLRNYVNAVVNLAQSDKPGGRIVTFTNVIFDTVAMASLSGSPQLSISMKGSNTQFPMVLQRDVVRLLNYQSDGVSGGDLQVFYQEQDSAFTIKKLGLTNAQAWATLGIAVADAVTPCTTTNAKIAGFTCPLTDLGPLVVLASRGLTNNPSYTLAYKVDGQKIVEPTPTLLTEGLNTLTRTIDLGAGAPPILKSFFVTLDTVPPTIEIVSLDPKVPTVIGLVNATRFVVKYKVVDNLGTSTQKHTFTNLPVGSTILTITAKDKAGNPAPPVSFEVVVDPTKTDIIPDGDDCGVGAKHKHGKPEPR